VSPAHCRRGGEKNQRNEQKNGQKHEKTERKRASHSQWNGGTDKREKTKEKKGVQVRRVGVGGRRGSGEGGPWVGGGCRFIMVLGSVCLVCVLLPLLVALVVLVVLVPGSWWLGVLICWMADAGAALIWDWQLRGRGGELPD